MVIEGDEDVLWGDIPKLVVVKRQTGWTKIDINDRSTLPPYTKGEGQYVSSNKLLLLTDEGDIVIGHMYGMFDPNLNDFVSYNEFGMCTGSWKWNLTPGGDVNRSKVLYWHPLPLLPIDPTLTIEFGEDLCNTKE